MSLRNLFAGRRRILVWVGLGLLVYFGNTEVQSWLGRKAVASMQLEEVPLPEAIRAASNQNRLVLADLSAIWCSTCRRLHSEVLSDPRVRQAIRDKYIFSRVEYESEEGKRFQKRYHVRGFPTLLVLDGRGEQVRRLNITFDPEQFLRNLEQNGEPERE